MSCKKGFVFHNILFLEGNNTTSLEVTGSTIVASF